MAMGAIRSAGTQYRFEWVATEPFDVDKDSPTKLRTAIARLFAPVRDLFFGAAMIPYAQLRFGRGFVPGHAAAYFVQRCVTHPTVRKCVASVLAAGVRSRHATLATRREPDLQDALGGLERDGIAMLPNLFATSELADVVGFFLNQPVAAPGGGCVARDGLPAGATMAAYHLATVVACPWLMTAINRADILRLASAFLGCKPTLCSIGVRWSFPGSKVPDATQAFHRDPDDWRFLKLFVYLTDVVDGESGPHIFVAGSHNTRRPLRAKTYAQEQLEARFGKQNMRAILGARGTTFIADTSGIHAGIAPQRAPRLLLQAQYSILPNFALHYRPVADPRHHSLDSYVNRLILASTGS
jgi:hypothetical protein